MVLFGGRMDRPVDRPVVSLMVVGPGEFPEGMTNLAFGGGQWKPGDVTPGPLWRTRFCTG